MRSKNGYQRFKKVLENLNIPHKDFNENFNQNINGELEKIFKEIF